MPPRPFTRSTLGLALAAAASALPACDTAPAVYDYGVDLDDVEFVLYDTTVGVHPNDTILIDPNNPFASTGVGWETKWEILDAGRWPATFYAWGTILAAIPTGEHQFYTAQAAQAMYDRREVETQDLYYVWIIAVDGYQSVLDHFPDSVTYDITGTVAYPLAPLAYNGMLSLGAQPEGWTMVTGDDGTQTVVRVTTGAEEVE